MVRIGVLGYGEQLPTGERLTAFLGERTAAALSENRRGNARIETLLGFSLLAMMVPEADLAAVTRTVAGRPFFAGRPDLDFSLTHCQGLVACAVAQGDDPRVGVDAEPAGGQTAIAMQRIAERWFSREGIAEWERDGRSEKTFLALWTLKEATAKWMGGGLRDLREADPSALARATYRVGNVVLSAVCDPGEKLPAEVERFSLPCA